MKFSEDKEWQGFHSTTDLEESVAFKHLRQLEDDSYWKEN